MFRFLFILFLSTQALGKDGKNVTVFQKNMKWKDCGEGGRSTGVIVRDIQMRPGPLKANEDLFLGWDVTVTQVLQSLTPVSLT